MPEEPLHPPAADAPSPDSPDGPADAALPRQRFWPRLLLALALIALAVAVGYFLFSTPAGRRWMHHRYVREWVAHHPVAAPLWVIGAYVVVGSLLLPVIGIQLLAGYCFGIFWGVLWVQIGATCSAVVSLLLSRWLIGQWFLDRFARRMATLRDLEEKLGHNGLLVVMAVRLIHVLPFGVGNYLMGLTTITAIDVALGTFWAGTSTSAFYACVGSDPRVVGHGIFWAAMAGLNLVLVVPLVLRYLKPQWFKRIGIE